MSIQLASPARGVAAIPVWGPGQPGATGPSWAGPCPLWQVVAPGTAAAHAEPGVAGREAAQDSGGGGWAVPLAPPGQWREDGTSRTRWPGC